MEIYLKDVRLSRSDDPLVWWSENEKKYPLLAPTARKYLAIPCSSSPSEREFKQCKQITKDRYSLKPRNVEMLLFNKYNMRAIGYKISDLQEVPEGFVCPNNRVTPVTADESDHDVASASDDSSQ